MGLHEKLQGLTVNIQGGSNMTGTVYTCLHTNQSRSYLNHLVTYSFAPEATARNHECKQHFQIRTMNISTSIPKTIASTHEYEEQFYIKGKAGNHG